MTPPRGSREILLIGHPVQGHHVLGNDFSEGKVLLIGRGWAPGFHFVPSLEETPDLVIEGTLPSTGRKVVPDRDPHAGTRVHS